jgi:hypothetical protein
MHGIRRHGHDRYIAFGWRKSAYLRHRADAVEFRHLDVHQDDVIGLADHGFDSEQAVIRNVHVVSVLFQQGHRELLIDALVFRQQDSQRS